MHSNEYISNFSQSFVVVVVAAAAVETLFSCEENLKNNQDWQRFKKAQEQIMCLTVNIFFQRSNICQQQRFFILFDLLNS